MCADLALEALLGPYCAGPLALRQALEGLAENNLDLTLDGQGWSIRQVVHHVVDGDDLWQAGLLAALDGLAAFDLRWYWSAPQDEWARAWHYAARPVQAALDFFEANRQHAASILRAVPGAAQRCTPVQWPDGNRKDIAVGDILEMQTRHVHGHCEDIRRVRQAHGV